MVKATQRQAPQRAGRVRAIGVIRHLAGVAGLALLLGCAQNPQTTLSADSIEALQLPGNTIDPAQVDISTPPLLALNDEMGEFVANSTAGLRTSRQRLRMLHAALQRPGGLGLEYDAAAGGSAADAFRRGSANCLSYAHLFVALAREAGLDAQYQWLEVRPQWTRLGERVALRLHVNVRVRLPRGGEYMVDIDPLQPREVIGTRLISDGQAAALYHNNIAMQELGEERLEAAYRHAVRALQLSPQIAHLWVNLGAIYRSAGQLGAAERSYLAGLQLDPGHRAAMNNLSVLYALQGREEESEQWQARLARYRDTNPYFHAWQGDMAGERQDWPLARDHYLQAVRLRDDDHRLLYELALILEQLGDYGAAMSNLEQAMRHARLVRDKENYRLRLESIARLQVAAS